MRVRSSDPQGVREPRRYLIATAVSHYPKCPNWDRPGLVQAREQIIDLFTQSLGYRHHTTLGLDPTRQQLREQLRAFCTSDERREDDLVVVYVSGHGEVLEDGSEHVLLMADTDPTDVPFTSLPTAELVRAFRGTRVRRLLLILDTCYSGQGGNELAAAALDRLGTQRGASTTSTGLVIVSSAQPHQQAKTGMLPHLFSQSVNSRATAGHAPSHLSISAVVQQMNDHADKPGYQHISVSLIGLTGEPPDFLTNPRHDIRLTDVDLALQDAAEFDAYALQRETEFTSRLLVRAMGYHGDASHGWWFCGRHRALAEITHWLKQKPDHEPQSPLPSVASASENVRVVTGGPGSGKTAVLGLVAALTKPERRRTVPADALGLEPEWVPEEGSIDVVLYAQGLTDNQVLSGLAAAVGFQCATVGEFLDGLEKRRANRERPFTALIDALDEAATPDSLCSQVIRPLIEHSRARIRLLLGTRPYLLDCLDIRTGDQSMVVDLDSQRYADRGALLAYTMRNLLDSRRTSPYRAADPRLLRHVAQAVAEAAGTSFLVARFAAYTLASADTVVADPRNRDWRASLPRHADQAMRDDLTRRLGPDARRATDLLRPLAFAEGQGLPWEDIWAPLASAVSGRTYTDEDLLWLRRNAGSYVVEATENGRSAYRLYHQALTEHLRDGVDHAAVHSAFIDTLTGCVPYRGDATRDYARAHPYTLNHLAAHAAAAGLMDKVLDVADYLVHAVPHTLVPYLQQASSSQARLHAAVYRAHNDLHASSSAPVRRGMLALDAARADATSLLEQLNHCAHADPWVPAWATGNDFPRALRTTMTELDGPVLGMACGQLDDRPVALISTYNSVSIRDLATGARIGEPLPLGPSVVQSPSCTVLDGRPVAVVGGGTAGGGNTVTMWDLASGRRVGKPFVHGPGPAIAMACTMLDGRPISVIGGDTVTVWDLTTGSRIGEPFAQGRNPISSVACSILHGRPVAVIGGIRFDGIHAGTISVWDLATGQRIGDPLTPSRGPVRSISCTALDGLPVAVTAGDTVAVWDLTSGRQICSLSNPGDSQVRSVSCTVLDGRPIAVTGGDTIAVWDLATGHQIGSAVIQHSDTVETLTCAVLDGRPVTVASSHHTVRVWDLSELASPVDATPVTDNGYMTSLTTTVLDGRPVAVTGGEEVVVWDVPSGRRINQSPTALGDGVRSVACTVVDGHPVAVTGGNCLSVRDLITGRLTHEFPIRDSGPVTSVACADIEGRPVAVTSGDETVSIWDVATGQRVGAPLAQAGDGRVHTVACTVLDGRPVAVTGGDSVVLWDLTDGRRIGEPLGQEGRSVHILACTVLDGRPIAVIGSREFILRTVTVWDLTSGRRLGQLEEFDGTVRSVACTVLDNRPLAVTGTTTASGTGHVRVWDLKTQVLLQHFVIPDLIRADVASDGSLVVLLGRDIAVLKRQAIWSPAKPELPS